MSHCKINDLLKHAIQNKYAVGLFESWNLESTLAVVRAAEIVRSPVIIGFCGAYLCNPERKFKEDLNLYAMMVKEIAREASVPIATMLNESNDVKIVYRAIKAGFNMVMFTDENMDIYKLSAVTSNIVEFAHACDVAVEAEVGHIPVANNATSNINLGNNTDPDLAVQFVKETGIDALAVAIGNVHLLEDKKAELDMDLLNTLHKRIDIPLVLHGGTGIDKDCFHESINLGVAKINVGAGLKRKVINAEKKYFLENDTSNMNPNDILGKGGIFDINVHSQDYLIEEVIEFIRAFGGENMAMR